MLVLSLVAFENKKYTAYHGNGPYGEIRTKKEPVRTLGFTLPYNKEGYFGQIFEEFGNVIKQSLVCDISS